MRKTADCREFPSEVGCTLTISGEEEEVVRAAVEHAISCHGETDSFELREQIRESLKDESPAGEELDAPAADAEAEAQR
jgi:predicted small metal-binding protein